MVIAGISGAIFNPATPAPKDGSIPNHTVMTITITPKIIPCNQILLFKILLDIGMKIYPKNNVKPTPFAIWKMFPMKMADSSSPATNCPKTTEMSRGIPVISMSIKAAM